jgi:hypothetical protein
MIVEKGIPVPPQKWERPKYPWKELDIGDSFLVPLSEHSFYKGAHTGAKHAGIKITVRTTPNGWRVWRVA